MSRLAQSSDANKSVSQAAPHTPPQQHARITFETPYTSRSLSPASEPPIVSTAPPEHLFTPTTTPRRYRTTNNLHGSHKSLRSHESRMVRSKVRSHGPQNQEDSPNVLGNWAPGGPSFNERMARLSTLGMSARGAPTQRNTFLDDISTSSSDNENENLNHSLHDSGYVSRFETPTGRNETSTGRVHEAQGATIRTDLVPAPVFFQHHLDASVSADEVKRTPELRSSNSLCDHRLCLRHKGTCLEHTPTPISRMIRGRTRRNTSGNGSRRYERDVWMQIASEYQVG